jgi:hypothetical protein
MSVLGVRLNKLEHSIPAPQKRGCVIWIIAGDWDQAGAQKLLEAEGYNPEGGDIAIVHYIVGPAGQPSYTEPPYLLDGGRQPAVSLGMQSAQ